MDRRAFLESGGSALVGTSILLGLPCLTACAGQTENGANRLSGRRWGMVIDLTRCQEDCTACLDACRRENNVALLGDERWDIHWIRKVHISPKDTESDSEKSVLLMCNHCDNPPCAQVCPVQATYKREDGIVVVDHHRCIGCRYCMIACPYNARYFNYLENPDWPNKNFPRRSHGVAESCTFCAHRLDQGMPPACVEACQNANHGALIHGDLNDHNSEVARLVAEAPVKRVREDWGTEPKVFYIGL